LQVIQVLASKAGVDIDRIKVYPLIKRFFRFALLCYIIMTFGQAPVIVLVYMDYKHARYLNQK